MVGSNIKTELEEQCLIFDCTKDLTIILEYIQQRPSPKLLYTCFFKNSQVESKVLLWEQ